MTIIRNLGIAGTAVSGQELSVLRGITLVLGLVSAFVGAFVGWILIAGLLYAFSAIFGGKGDFKMLLKFTAFSFIPSILLSPISVYLNYESLSQLVRHFSMEALIMPTLFGVVVLFWQYLYWIFAVKNARALDLKKSAISAGILLVLYLCFTALGFYFSLSFQQIAG